MIEGDVQLASLFVQYAATIAADLTKAGVGRLARSFKSAPLVEPELEHRLNTMVQSELVGKHVSPANAERVAEFLLHSGNLSYFLYMHYVALSSSDLGEQALELRRFERELAAHLVLEAGVDGTEAEVNDCVVSIKEMLSQLETHQLRAAGRASLPRTAANPSSTFAFSESESREELFRAMGEPDLSAFLAYSKSYARAALDHFGTVQFQHLGPDVAPVSLDDIYVRPELEVDAEVANPRVAVGRVKTLVQSAKVDFETALSLSGRSVFLGPAGIGKSTFVKAAATAVARVSPNDPMVPFVIELKNYQMQPNSRLFIEFIGARVAELVQATPPKGWIDYMLLTGRAVVLFDGYDEVLNLGDRTIVRDAIRSFARLYVGAPVVVTSRLHGYDAAPFASNEFLTIELRDFDEPRIRQYARKWFEGKKVGGTNSGVDSFLEETAKYATELRANPLMLGLLCSVYFYKGDIPRTLSDLYERCAAMMFREWDTIRSIEGDEAWDKTLRPALYHLAATVLRDRRLRGKGVPITDLERLLQAYWVKNSTMDAEESLREARRVIEIWSGRAWIITAIASDASNRPLFGFVHQSFLEYFAAVHEARASDGPEDLYDRLVPTIIQATGWPVSQMAISVFELWHQNGGSRVVDALLEDFPTRGVDERLQLLKFGLELVQFVPFQKATQAELLKRCLDVYASSIILPAAGMTLRGLHEEARLGRGLLDDFEDDEFADFEPDTDFSDDLDEDEDEDEFDLLNGLERAGGLEDDAAYDSDFLVSERSTMGTEPLVDRMLALYPTRDVVAALDASNAIAADSRPFVTAAFVLEVAGDRGLIARDDIVRAASSMYKYDRREKSTDWLAGAAAFALGVIDADEASELLPWNVQLSRESLVLSLISDVDVPAVVHGDIANDYLVAESFGSRLWSIGRSILRMTEPELVQWDLVPASGQDEFVVVEDPRSLGQVLTDDWSEEGFAGAFVILAVIAEMYGPESLTRIAASQHSKAFRQLIESMINTPRDGSEVVQRDLFASGVPRLVASLVARWSQGTLPLTDSA